MDIGSWLRELGLERYEQAFRENEIDLRVLPKLTAEDLKELGVAAIGGRAAARRARAATFRIGPADHEGDPSLSNSDPLTNPVRCQADSIVD
jgi:SAM domain (Sterile alpha motif)